MKQLPGVDIDLQKLADKLKRWRQTRASIRERVPEDLWNGAVKAALIHGISRTVNVTRLDYYGLKRRLENAAETSPSFIQLDVPIAPEQKLCDAKLVVELSDDSGRRMRLEVPHQSPVDVVALAHSFFGCAS